MRKSILLSALAVLAAAALPSRAAADEIVRAHVPFAFHVLETTLPAGDYVVSSTEGMDQSVLVIRAVPRGPEAFFLIERGRTVPAGSHAQFVFDRYGTDRFLRAIRLEDEPEQDLMVSSAESGAALAAAHATSHPSSSTGSGAGN